MPALSYSAPNGIIHFIPPLPYGQKVPVRLKSGQHHELEFLGFICPQGAKLISSHYAKILVDGITQEDSVSFSNAGWRYLSHGEYVVGCLVRRAGRYGQGNGFCVYALLDDDGWPMVRGENDSPLRSIACA